MPIFIATADKDVHAGSDPQTLCSMINCGNKLQVYQDNSRHGTDMFLDSSLNPPLSKLVVSWLNGVFGALSLDHISLYSPSGGIIQCIHSGEGSPLE